MCSSDLLPLPVAYWNLLALEKIKQADEKRRQVLALADWVRRSLRELGFTVLGNSQIVPIVVGSSDAVLALGQSVRAQGFWPGVIRPPTVPAGACRLRCSIHACLTEEVLKTFVQVLRDAE